ncbi:MAG: LssY C-terminal domain-containing protein [Pseudodesulfovibrio sp.]
MFIKNKTLLCVTLFILVATVGCTKQYTPMPLEDLEVISRAETQSQGGITVSASILNGEESLHVFGVDLEKVGVQPVWIEVENSTNAEQLFLSMSVDQNYFSPHEVWWKTRYEKDKEASARMDARFKELMLPDVVGPKSSMSGFVLTPIHAGSVRLINMDILGLKKLTSFTFFLKIPGFLADHHLVDVDSLYTEDQLIRCNTMDELRQQIEALPCCVTDKSGEKQGDPLNVVLVSPKDAAWKAVVRRGWDETEPINFGSSMKTVNAFMAHKEYKTSPISALYVFGRGQDIGLQKARKTIHERNHLRMWLTPIVYKDNRVWVGTISRDIGVRMTSKTWNLTTHEIDGNVDEARSYLIQDLAYSQALKNLAFAGGVAEVSEDAPKLNLTDSAWYTDGYRAVLFLSKEDIPMAKIKLLDWKHPR